MNSNTLKNILGKKFIFLFLISLLFLPDPSFSSNTVSYNGNNNKDDIMLQAFHWESHEGGGGKKWYQIITDNADKIGKYFTTAGCRRQGNA